MTNNSNPFHLVNISPWPILTSTAALLFTSSLLIIINNATPNAMLTAAGTLLILSYLWWRDIHRESADQGHHPTQVINSLNIGIILFIVSEIFFFASFFWAFFHSSISPSVEIGQSWPPQSISSFNPISIPLLNTILLLSSGVSVTWCHHSILNNNFSNSNNTLNTTIILGVIFTTLQGFEYTTAPFSITDSCFGSTFFIATGFHGLHVILGSTFLTISIIRYNNIVNSNSHLVGFECAAWYWHFVDIIWLFLYSIIYWWGA